MERTIDIMLSSNLFLLLVGLLATALFFLMIAIRELMSDRYEGLVYIPLAMFFGTAHGFCLWYFPINSPAWMILADLSFWTWLAYVLAPALALLFILLGVLSAMRINLMTGAVKLFFGLTLVCFLFMLGSGWGTDWKGIITLIYGGMWFHVELAGAA